MTLVNAQNLPWYLIGVLVTGMLAVFYAMLRGKIIPSRVADLLRESAEKRAEIAEAGVAANTESVRSLVESVGKLMVLAENQDKVLKALHAAERLRDQAEEQRGRADRLVPRVDRVSSSLEKLRTDNHIGPMIDAILRGTD